MDEGPKDSKPGAVPRGASPSEQDHLRAVVKVAPRPTRTPTRMNRPTLPPPPMHAPQHQALPAAEVNKIIDEGRALLDTDRASAHPIFDKANRRHLNDRRVLPNSGIPAPLVAG